MNKASESKIPSKFIRYLLAAHNVVLLLNLNYLTDLGEGDTVDTIFAILVLSAFIISVWALVVGSVEPLGNNFWIAIAFQLILAAVSLWMGISFIIEETPSMFHLFDGNNFETIAYLYLIPGSLLSLWTAFVFFKKFGKADQGR